MTISVLESWTWPWEPWTLYVAYLMSGLFIAGHYAPQIYRAWQFPSATLIAQSLPSWLGWTGCLGIAFAYGVFVIHDLVFLVVVGADMLGRLAMVALIVRAHAVGDDLTRPIELTQREYKSEQLVPEWRLAA